MKFIQMYWKRFVVVSLIIVTIAIVGFLVWASTPAGVLMPTALDALESSDTVMVVQNEWLVFAPIEREPKTGFIFYPGGRVLVDAYAPLGQQIADEGYLAVFVPMPLNLAILNVDAANAVIEAYSEVDHWVIAGHSLGGAMAARYVHNNPNRVDGLVMMAAFPEVQFDFTERNLAVASIYGSLDGLATVEEVEASRPLLPDDAEFILIEGGNHAQFGWYGAQAGDNEAIISHEEQYEQIVDGVIGVLESVSQ